MLNFKTFIKTVYRNSRYFYQDFVNGYNVFTFLLSLSLAFHLKMW